MNSKNTRVEWTNMSPTIKHSAKQLKLQLQHQHPNHHPHWMRTQHKQKSCDKSSHFLHLSSCPHLSHVCVLSEHITTISGSDKKDNNSSWNHCPGKEKKRTHSFSSIHFSSLLIPSFFLFFLISFFPIFQPIPTFWGWIHYIPQTLLHILKKQKPSPTSTTTKIHVSADELIHEKEKFRSISDELDSTFFELTGY